MARHDREASVAGFLDGRNGWARNPFDVPGMISHLTTTYPTIPIVDDGPTAAGRGSTGADLFRKRETGKMIRYDVLSVKTTKMDDDSSAKSRSPKFPSKVSLCTGNKGAPGLVEAMLAGAPLPTLIFASDDSGDGNGFACMMDFGKIARENPLVFAPEGGFGKGHAPPFYLKWSAARKCGHKGFGNYTRGDLDFPHTDAYVNIAGEDFPARRWISPDRVQYAEVCVSLYACGIRKDDWSEMNPAKLPSFVEAFSWNNLVEVYG